jgi:hypothetical protein
MVLYEDRSDRGAGVLPLDRMEHLKEFSVSLDRVYILR